jgi:phage anti-repressor protein
MINQLSLFLIHNKDYIKNYQIQVTEKKVKYQDIRHLVIDLNREIFLCLKDNYLIQVKVFMKKKIMIFKIKLMILDLKKLFMISYNKK